MALWLRTLTVLSEDLSSVLGYPGAAQAPID